MQEVLLPTAVTDLSSTNLSVKSPISETGKAHHAAFIFENAKRRYAFLPQPILSTSPAAWDSALQQASLDYWRTDWFWNDDLEKSKTRQKTHYRSTVPSALTLPF